MPAAVFQVAGSSSDDGSIPDLEAAASQIAHFAPAAESKEQLVRALLLVSHASIFVGVSAGLHLPAATGSVLARHQAAYYNVVAALLAAVPVEMATAFWLRRSNSWGLQAFAQVLQRVGVVLLIIVSAVGGMEFTVKA